MAGAPDLEPQDVYRTGLDPIVPSHSRLRPLHRRHRNLGLKFRLCVRGQKHLEARSPRLLVNNLPRVILSGVAASLREAAAKSKLVEAKCQSTQHVP